MSKRKDPGYLDADDLVASAAKKKNTQQQKKEGSPATAQADPLARDAGNDTEARMAVVQVLLKALQEGMNGAQTVGMKDTEEGAQAADEIAQQIEEELYQLQGRSSSGREYKTSVRNLVANIKRNRDLRSRLLSGDLAPGEVVRMTSAQLATATAQKARAQAQERLLRRAVLHDSDAAEVQGTSAVGEHRCPQCKSTACSVIDASRRDIGKSSTWGSKDAEDSRGRVVTCLTCHHKWEAGLIS